MPVGHPDDVLYRRVLGGYLVRAIHPVGVFRFELWIKLPVDLFPFYFGQYLDHQGEEGGLTPG